MILNTENVTAVLQSAVNPQLQSHGGGVELRSISEEGEIQIALTGACSTCPAHNETVQTFVKEALEASFGKDTFRLTVVQGVSDALIAEAKRILHISRDHDTRLT